MASKTMKNFSVQIKTQAPIFLFIFLAFRFGLNFSLVNALIICFFAGTIFFGWRSRVSLCLGLIFFVLMPLFLILKDEKLTAYFGVLAFSFFGLGVLAALFEYNRSQGNFCLDFNPYLEKFFKRWALKNLLLAMVNQEKRSEVKELFKLQVKEFLHPCFLKTVTLVAFLALLFFLRPGFPVLLALLIFSPIAIFSKNGLTLVKIGFGLFVLDAFLLAIGKQIISQWLANFIFYFLLLGFLIELRHYFGARFYNSWQKVSACPFLRERPEQERQAERII